ncbi:MAG TPA: ribonuclease HII [Steroidobacteraceae bacterium]|nr:ribonuclease HII [Steroidobacteraceae bacterium]
MSRSFEFLAGVDEAGRGPLAGPVYAAAVILHPGRRIPGLRDSKQLNACQRAELSEKIRLRAIAWHIAWSDVEEIDCLNILGATLLAMRRAVAGLGQRPVRVLVDGDRLPSLADLCGSVEPVVGGDATVAAISAASILAKHARDALMPQLDAAYPGYQLHLHKGYATAIHLEALTRLGPCPQHRRSFAPVRDADSPRP